jgi:hypothetical protein
MEFQEENEGLEQMYEHDWDALEVLRRILMVCTYFFFLIVYINLFISIHSVINKHSLLRRHQHFAVQFLHLRAI